MPYYLLIITTVYSVYSMLVCLNPDFSFITKVDATENDNTNYNENIADCEHRSRNRYRCQTVLILGTTLLDVIFVMHQH